MSIPDLTIIKPKCSLCEFKGHLNDFPIITPAYRLCPECAIEYLNFSISFFEDFKQALKKGEQEIKEAKLSS